MDLALSVILIATHPIDTRGMDFFDGAFHPIKHQIDVMDHQIVHDANIGAASSERTGPNRMDLPGNRRSLTHPAVSGIESFDMPNLQDTAVAASRFDEHIGF
jgi:hypothetical protein